MLVVLHVLGLIGILMFTLYEVRGGGSSAGTDISHLGDKSHQRKEIPITRKEHKK